MSLRTTLYCRLNVFTFLLTFSRKLNQGKLTVNNKYSLWLFYHLSTKGGRPKNFTTLHPFLLPVTSPPSLVLSFVYTCNKVTYHSIFPSIDRIDPPTVYTPNSSTTLFEGPLSPSILPFFFSVGHSFVPYFYHVTYLSWSRQVSRTLLFILSMFLRPSIYT